MHETGGAAPSLHGPVRPYLLRRPHLQEYAWRAAAPSSSPAAVQRERFERGSDTSKLLTNIISTSPDTDTLETGAYDRACRVVPLVVFIYVNSVASRLPDMADSATNITLHVLHLSLCAAPVHPAPTPAFECVYSPSILACRVASLAQHLHTPGRNAPLWVGAHEAPQSRTPTAKRATKKCMRYLVNVATQRLGGASHGQEGSRGIQKTVLPCKLNRCF